MSLFKVIMPEVLSKAVGGWTDSIGMLELENAFDVDFEGYLGVSG